jgi:hypothetical protein
VSNFYIRDRSRPSKQDVRSPGYCSKELIIIGSLTKKARGRCREEQRLPESFAVLPIPRTKSLTALRSIPLLQQRRLQRRVSERRPLGLLATASPIVNTCRSSCATKAWTESAGSFTDSFQRQIGEERGSEKHRVLLISRGHNVARVK